MRFNQEGYIEIVTVSIILGIIGALFITGLLVWHEIDNNGNEQILVVEKVRLQKEDVKIEGDYFDEKTIGMVECYNSCKEDYDEYNCVLGERGIMWAFTKESCTCACGIEDKDYPNLAYIGYGYYGDGDSVYYKKLEHGWVKEVEFISKSIPSGGYTKMDVDYDSFKALGKLCAMGGCSGFAQDKNDTYSGGSSLIEHLINFRNIDVDVDSFRYLQYNYFRDKNKLYYWGYGWGTVDYIDLDTLEILDYMYIKDKGGVYRFIDGFEILNDEDPNTFVSPIK